MGFEKERLSNEEIKKLENLRKECIRDILTMTTLANSGHPGGAISSLDIYLIVFSYANISPEKIDDPDRDKIIISHDILQQVSIQSLEDLGFLI
jgi:transketolase